MVSLQNLVISNFPNTSTPQIIGTRVPTFSWSIQSGVPTLYELQVKFNSTDFSNPTVDTGSFQSPGHNYVLAPEFTLTSDGVYYYRVRGYDGSWGSWSSSFGFNVVSFPPNPPTIDTVISPSNSFSQVITGTKDAGLFVYISTNDNDWAEASYPTSTTWSYTVNLSAGTNTIEAVTSATRSVSGSLSMIVSTNIYLSVVVPEVYNVWNCFDEMGLLLGLQRIPGENNRQYRDRLLDVYQNPGNSTFIGLLNAISRELGLPQGLIGIYRLSDLMDKNYPFNLLNKDGNAIGTPLETYSQEVYDHNPVFFGNVISDESYWDSVDPQTNGYRFLPHIWDASASGVLSKWQSGGIGDFNDLWVNNPIEIWNTTLGAYSWYFPIHTGYFYAANPSGITT